MSQEVYINSAITDFLENQHHLKNMKLLHWTYIIPQSYMFEYIPSCDCCSGSHYVECLYQTNDGIYIIRRYGFNTLKLQDIHLSGDKFIEPTNHPYIGYRDFNDFFYTQFVDNVVSPRNSNSSSRSGSLSNSRNNSQPGSRSNSRPPSRRNSGKLSNSASRIFRKNSKNKGVEFIPGSL